MLKNTLLIPDMAARTSSGLVRSPATIFGSQFPQCVEAAVVAAGHRPHGFASANEDFAD